MAAARPRLRRSNGAFPSAFQRRNSANAARRENYAYRPRFTSRRQRCAFVEASARDRIPLHTRTPTTTTTSDRARGVKVSRKLSRSSPDDGALLLFFCNDIQLRKFSARTPRRYARNPLSFCLCARSGGTYVYSYVEGRCPRVRPIRRVVITLRFFGFRFFFHAVPVRRVLSFFFFFPFLIFLFRFQRLLKL